MSDMRHLAFSISIALMVLFPVVGHGIMTIRYHSAERHDRFYQGTNKEFVGESLDFSGVGIGKSGYWATLVSDNCFLSSNHRHPCEGDTVTFWVTNDQSGASFCYTVTGGVRIGMTDLWIGWFDNSVKVDASICRYPIPVLPALTNYFGLVLYNYGVDHRVGRNVLDRFGVKTVGRSTGVVIWYDYDFNDFPFVGGDETFLVSGDSGGPSFSVFNSRLVLLGIHWASTNNPTGSLDTFIPEYIVSINKVLSTRNQALQEYRLRQSRRIWK